MPSILLSFLELVTGILLLFSGGEFFIQGSVALALILGIPQLVIGLTIAVSYTHLTLPTSVTV